MANTCKYYKQKRQVSYDGGQTWMDVSPAEYRKGELYESSSMDCGGGITIYRWVNLNPSVDYYCSGTTKYYKQQKQQSTDNGVTWTYVSPAEYQMGSVNEYNSEDCGYVPPTFDGKFKANYSGGTTYSAACDSDTTLKTATTKPSGYNYSVMTDAEIGDCVTSIGYGAFRDCTNLSNVTIGNNVTSIGDSAFYSATSLTSIEIPSGVTTIDRHAFEWCTNLSKITIPNSVTTLGYQAFSECYALSSCTIGSSVTSIGNHTFYRCFSLTSIDIPNSVTTIGDSAFHSCSGLTSVILGDNVTSIGAGAFIGCRSLTSIDIPNGVTSIGDYAFQNCPSLSSCTIGSGVTSIGECAFIGCSSLTSFIINATTPPALGNDVFYASNNVTIYVPSASVNAYKSASGWSTYASRIQAIT